MSAAEQIPADALQSHVLAVDLLTQHDTDAMYALYASCYADTAHELFLRDLADKSYTVLLRDAAGVVQGFSTLKLYRTRWQDQSIRVIFSGDTLIAPEHWGSQRLAFEWIRFAGQIKRDSAGSRLVWFLICKGHRTYRYLRAFARDYAPRFDRATAPLAQTLMDHLAHERFGSVYDAASGLLRFTTPQGRLAPELAQVPDAHRRLPEVAHFLALNPHYARGDELVCLCELDEDNLRPLARRVFAGL